MGKKISKPLEAEPSSLCFWRHITLVYFSSVRVYSPDSNCVCVWGCACHGGALLSLLLLLCVVVVVVSSSAIFWGSLSSRLVCRAKLCIDYASFIFSEKGGGRLDWEWKWKLGIGNGAT